MLYVMSEKKTGCVKTTAMQILPKTWGTYHFHGKIGPSGWKIKLLGSGHSVWAGSENMGYYLRQCNF